MECRQKTQTNFCNGPKMRLDHCDRIPRTLTTPAMAGLSVSAVPVTSLLVLLGAVLPFTSGHGSLIQPASWNAFDRFLPQFSNGRGAACNCGDPAKGCDVGNRDTMNGQSCFYFSQGCFIGCANCTGTNIEHNGMPANETELNATARTCVRGYPPAGASFMPTLPKRVWSMNRGTSHLHPINDILNIDFGQTRFAVTPNAKVPLL